jgi:hypothetical protein
VLEEPRHGDGIAGKLENVAVVLAHNLGENGEKRVEI